MRVSAKADYALRALIEIASVTDGSAVLGLGNIGPGAALPVMAGVEVATIFDAQRFG